MSETMDYSAEQLARLRAKLADVKGELRKNDNPGISDIGSESYVRVSDDAMTAWVYLDFPDVEGNRYDVNGVLAFLKERKILYGIDFAKLNEMIMESRYGVEEEIAHGKAEVPGTDGFYEYKFDTNSKKSPKVFEDGSVDYTSMYTVQNVLAGDVLAIYHHAVQGKDGFNVYGAVVHPTVAKELSPLRGRNISNAENPDVYVSLIDGKIELKDNQIDIQNTHEIQGDVDWLMGKIEFFGDIIIDGNVEAGVTLRAGRNIVIRGTAGAVTMYAGGDIILERGVQGAQKAKLSARGNIVSEFLEHSTVEAGGDVQTSALIDCTVSAGGQITLVGKQGRIIGGNVHATKGIVAISAGNVSETKTILHAGFENKVYEEVLRLTNEEKETNQTLQKVLEEMALIIKCKQQGTKLPGRAMEAHLPVLNERKDELFAQLDTVKKDLEFYKTLMEKSRGARIEVSGPIYRGVIIGIDNLQLRVQENTSYMRYVKLGGAIQESVIAY